MNHLLSGLLSFGSEAHKRAVFNKGHIIPNFSPDIWRRDDFGCAIKYDDHGHHTTYGWEIDHIQASALGGHDGIENLRPLHISNNRALGGIIGGIINRK